MNPPSFPQPWRRTAESQGLEAVVETGPPSVGDPPLDPLEHTVLRRLDEIERRLRDTQAIAARTYETTKEWPRLLAQMRAEPSYDAAFHGDPLVTVRIATYNRGEILCDRAIASLRRQTYEHWEALVVGDACDDDTEQRITALGDGRIRYWNLAVRGPYPEEAQARWFVAGMPPANAAIAEARGAWIAPLDDDDEWDDDHVEVLLRAAQRERAELTYSRLRVIDDVTGARSELGSWPPVRGEFAFQSAIHHAGLRRFPYDPNARFAEEPGDWNLARRMWDAGVRFGFLDRATGTYHHVPKHQARTSDEQMIEELRGWAAELQKGLDWWKERAEWFEDELDRVRGGQPST